MQKLKNFTLSEKALLRILGQKLREGGKPRLRIDEAERMLGDLCWTAVKSLKEKGYVKVEGEHLELTQAAIYALKERKPVQAAVISFYKGKAKTHKHSVAIKKKLEQRGEKAYYGYILKGAKSPTKSQPHLTAQQALKLLKQGKTRYAALKAYSLALKLGNKELIQEARKTLKNPTPKKVAKTILKIAAHLNKKNKNP